MNNYAVYFTNPKNVSIKKEPIPVPKKNELLVKNKWSAISAGTEMLFYQGLIPSDLDLDATIPSLKHEFKYPFKYGYCGVGQILEAGSSTLQHLVNKWVFVFNPHESYFCTTENHIILLPDNFSPKQALFIPSMETAINLVLDGSPLIGEKVAILGLGIIGLLTTILLQQFPLTVLAGSDLYLLRRNLCLDLGANLVLDPNKDNFKLLLGEADLVYELTGNPNALNSAIDYVGYDGRIVLGSWYGRKQCALDLGGKFHRNRIKIISSQVSTLASKLKGRWDKTRRLQLVFNMLEKIEPSRFISHEIPIRKANEAYELLHNMTGDCLLVILTYED